MKQGLKRLWELQMDCQNAECSRTCLLSQSSFCLQRVWRCSLLCVCLCFLALNGMEGKRQSCTPPPSPSFADASAFVQGLMEPLQGRKNLFSILLMKMHTTKSYCQWTGLWGLMGTRWFMQANQRDQRASAFVLHESSWGSGTFFWCQNTHCSFGWPLANVYGFMQNAGWANSTWYPL